jgi:hypothetical protein
MSRGRIPQPKGPDWPAERVLRLLRDQLEKLQEFRGKSWQETKHKEEQWQQLTGNIITHGFGEESRNIGHFTDACWKGTHNLMGISDWQAQKNFELRIEAFQGTLESCISELEASLPEAEIQAAYAAGDEFAFYADLKGILAAAAKEVFVIDNYLNSDFFELYVTPIAKTVRVRILTNAVGGNLLVVATKFATRGNFELKTSKDVHDRHVFVDGRGWIIGQSIKDAAKKKPTYMIEISTTIVTTVQDSYEGIWAGATSVLKT